jgi:hypothetical protein
MRRLTLTALLLAALAASPATQDARSVIERASNAMGLAGLHSISYSGEAASGNFGQSRTISFGLVRSARDGPPARPGSTVDEGGSAGVGDAIIKPGLIFTTLVKIKPGLTRAHHSFSNDYLEDDTIEVEGEIVEFQYRNQDQRGFPA